MFLWVIPWVPWVILHHFIVVFGTSICPWNVDVRTSRGTPDPRPRILTPGELEEQKLLEDKSKDRWTEGRWLSKQIQLERLRSDCGVLSWPDQIISWVVLCPKNEDYHGFSSRMRDYQWLSTKRGIIMDSHLFGIQDCKHPSDPQTQIQDRLLKSWEARREALSEARLGRGFYDRQYSISCLYYTHRIHVCYIWEHLPSIHPQC